MKSNNKAQKYQSTWRVKWNGVLTSPTFNCKGAAQAYANMLANGQRKPEYSK